jgi:hypothetical protein
MKMVQWKRFLQGHRSTTSNVMGTFEVDVKEVDLNAFINRSQKENNKKCNFIWIGILNAFSPRKIEMQKDSLYFPHRHHCCR